MILLITWLAVGGVPVAIVLGGGAAYVRCRVRGELRTVSSEAAFRELARQR